MGDGKWIRWLGATAALLVLGILVFNRHGRHFWIGTEPKASDVLLYLGGILLPAFSVAFLSAFARFWWAFSLGLWLFLLSVLVCIDEKASPVGLLLVLATATICFTPFLNIACHPKGPDTNKDSQSPNPTNKL